MQSARDHQIDGVIKVAVAEKMSPEDAVQWVRHYATKNEIAPDEVVKSMQRNGYNMPAAASFAYQDRADGGRWGPVNDFTKALREAFAKNPDVQQNTKSLRDAVSRDNQTETTR